MEDVASILFSMRVKGIKIWTDKGKLYYDAPRRTLTPSDVANLRTLKREIINFLQRSRFSASTEEPLVPRDPSERVPLAICQLFFWNIFSQNSGQSRRPPTLIKRLSGHLDIKALERALTELTRRHEILRTNIVTEQGAPTQKIREPSEIKLERIHVTGASAAEREDNARRLIKRLAEQIIDVAIDPLFKPGLLILGEEDQIFFVLMDHIIFDGPSVQILDRDITTLFSQAAHQRQFSLPAMPIQFADYAVWQQRTRASRVDVHDAFWKARLAGARHVRVFSDGGARTNPSKLVRHMVRFEPSLTITLRRLSVARRTTLMLSLLTMYVALLSRWCNRADLVVSVPTVTRRHPEVENTIGPLGVSLFLRVGIFEDDSFIDLLRRVADEYNSAYEHDDSGKLAAKAPPPEFVSNACFSFFSKNYRTLSVPSWSDAARFGNSLEDVPFELNLELDGIDYGHTEPILVVIERQDDMVGFLEYRSNLATLSTVERFVEHLQLFAWRLAEEPGGKLPRVAYGC